MFNDLHIGKTWILYVLKAIHDLFCVCSGGIYHIKL
jgi:hypothetical protein